MSTSDPRVERIERQARAAHSPGALITLLITGAAHTAIWIAAGYGIGILLDTFRLMSVNQVGNWTSALDGTSSQLLGIGAIAVGSVLGVFFTGRLGRFGLGWAMIVPFCTAFLGIALGLVLFIPNWTAADLVGEKVPFIDGGEPEPWQSDAWVAYYLPFWLPAVVGVVFVLSVLGAVAVSRSTRRRSDRMRDIEARGTRVPGLVSEAIATGTEIQGMPRIRFTTRFRDTAGTERWVTKTATFPRASTPRAGDPAVVWFDPAEPHNETKIMVGLGPDAGQLTATDQMLPTAYPRG
jgi:hypothetical protein